MTAFAKALILVIGLAVAGCNFHATTSQSKPELNTTADAAYRDLVAGRDDALVGRMTKATDVAQVRAQMPMLRTLVGEQTPPRPVVMGTQSVASTGGSTYVVLQDYDYPDRVVHTRTHFVDDGGQWAIEGFNVNVTRKAAGDAGAVTPVASAEPGSTAG